MVIKVGDSIPNGKLSYVQYSEELDDLSACGNPVLFDPVEAWKGKKVILVTVPGAFTPGCHMKHLPPYIEKSEHLRNKHQFDEIVFLASNDPFVMSAWGRVTGGSKAGIHFVSDLNAQYAAKMGLEKDTTEPRRIKRSAIILNDNRVVYVGVDEAGLNESGVEAVMTNTELHVA